MAHESSFPVYWDSCVILQNGGRMEVLTAFQNICSSQAYDELRASLDKEESVRVLKKYQSESTQCDGLPVYEKACNLLLWITDSVLSINGSNYIEPEFSAEDIHEIESLLSVFHVVLSSIMKTAKKSSTNEIKQVIKKTAPIAVIVCASHMEQHQWTSQVTLNTAKEILQLLCDGCQVESTSQLLAPNRNNTLVKSQGFQSGLLDSVLDILLTRLESWTALHYASHWCITQVKYPNLGDHLAKLLTLSLKLTDNHQVSHKVIGVKCLYHIMKNSNAAELIWYGRCDVIFELLQRLFYLSEPALLEILYPCIILNLQIFKTRDKDKMTQHYDKVIQVVLTSMEYEAKQPLRRVHILFLKDIVSLVGLHLLCYFKRFLDIVMSYLEVYDEQREEMRINALQVLKTAMLNLWPRVGRLALEILQALLKLIIDCADIDNAETKENLLDSCIPCLVVLHHCCPDHVMSSFHSLKEEVNHKEILYCINKVLEEVTTCS